MDIAIIEIHKGRGGRRGGEARYIYSLIRLECEFLLLSRSFIVDYCITTICATIVATHIYPWTTHLFVHVSICSHLYIFMHQHTFTTYNNMHSCIISVSEWCMAWTSSDPTPRLNISLECD